MCPGLVLIGVYTDPLQKTLCADYVAKTSWTEAIETLNSGGKLGRK